jgi:hypothetical protein
MNRSWRRLVSLAVLAVLALVSFGPLHLDDESQSNDHCAVCHLRHVSVVTPLATFVDASPLVIARTPVADHAETEQDAFQRLHPSRGPPA